MKKAMKYIFITVFLTTFFACKDFSELEQNPNRPSEVPPSIILRGVLSDLNEEPWSLEHRQNQFWACNYNYYGTNEYWTYANLNYTTLRNIVKMEEQSTKTSEAVNPYTAIGKFLKAYFFVRMTQKVGDLPLKQALQGLDNVAPVYDSQKEIYLYVLKQLGEANAELKTLIASNDNSLSGDIYFGNDLLKWRKLVNTFKLRVLISLSKKESDADLGVKAKFAEVINNPAEFPVMGSNEDNMSYVYNGTTQLYPTNPGSRGFDKGRYNMAQTYVKGLTDLKDPRVFVACNPAKALVKPQGTLEADDFGAYAGAPSGESLDDMTFKAGQGLYSYANQKRYYTTFTGPEAGVQVAYWELCFNIAEAINRGWVAGSADDYYQKGIRASMAHMGIEDGASINITESDNDEVLKTVSPSVTAYLAQPAVAYKGNNADGLSQILTQKYLAFFQNSGQEAYFNYRRTGIPAFHAGPGTGNTGVIPKRWLYPTSESYFNESNYRSALRAQFGSDVDDVDNELWIVK